MPAARLALCAALPVRRLPGSATPLVHSARALVLAACLLGVLVLSASAFAQVERYLLADWPTSHINFYNVADDTWVSSMYIRTGTHPTSVVVSPNGHLAFVTNINQNYVSVLDLPTSREIKAIRGIRARTLAITPDGTKVIVPYCSFPGTNADRVAIIDTATLTSTEVNLNGLVGDTAGNTADIYLGSVVATNTKAYIATAANAPALGVVTIDLATKAVGRIDTSTYGPGFVYQTGIALTPDGAYVCVLQGASLVIINTATSTFQSLGLPTTGFNASSLAITKNAADPNGVWAYVTMAIANSPVHVVDVKTGSPTFAQRLTAPTAAVPFNISYKYEMAISANGGKLYVIGDDVNTPYNFVVFDTAMLRAGSVSVISQNRLGTKLQAITTASVYDVSPGNMPFITSVEPAYVENSVASTITINGSNFASDSRVRIGNLDPLPVSNFISSTQIEVTLPARAAAQLADVLVTNPNLSLSPLYYHATNVMADALTIDAARAFAPAQPMYVSGLGEFWLYPLARGLSPERTIYEPRGFVFNQDGSAAFVGSMTFPSLGIVNLSAGSGTTLGLEAPVGNRDGVAIGKDMALLKRAYAVSGHYITGVGWVDRLKIIDADTTSATFGQEMSILDGTSGGDASIHGGMAVALDGHYVYTLSASPANRLVIIDTWAGTYSYWAVTSLNAYPNAIHMSVTPDSNYLLLRAANGNDIQVDCLNPAVCSGNYTAPGGVATITGAPCVTGASFQWFQVVGSKLYAFDPYQHIVEAFNFLPASSNFSCLGSATVPAVDTLLVDPMAVSSDGAYVYVGLKEENVVAVLDANKVATSDPAALITKIAAGRSPDNFAERPVGVGSEDLAVSVAAPTTPVPPGSPFDIIVSVSNVSPIIPLADVQPSAHNVVLTLDTGVDIGIATESCSGTVKLTCNLGTATRGGLPIVWTFSATAPVTSGNLNIHAVVSAWENDPDLANNSATSVVSVPPVADVHLIHPDLPPAGPVQLNGQTAHEAIVGNNGPASASNVVFTATLNRYTIQSYASEVGTCSHAGNVVTCQIGSLSSSQHVWVKVAATGPKKGWASITYRSTASTLDPVPHNNEARVTGPMP